MPAATWAVPDFGRMFRGRRNGGDNGGGPPRGGMFGQSSPELEALNNAIDSNAPTEQIKAAMQKYCAAHKAKQAALEKAQKDLKSILTINRKPWPSPSDCWIKPGRTGTAVQSAAPGSATASAARPPLCGHCVSRNS